LVFVNPNKSVRREYKKLGADLIAFRNSLKGMVDLPSRTLDGADVILRANIGKSADAESASLVKAEGVGLFRTEFSFSIRSAFPTEEEQFQITMAVAERFHPHAVAVRVLLHGVAGGFGTQEL
jgi:phosphotransferase system enzyme I (PtsI)